MEDETRIRIPDILGDMDTSGNDNETDSRSWLYPVLGDEGTSTVTVTSVPVDRDADHYNMTHPNRGVALIFNNKTFDAPELTTRNGTDQDRSSLANALRNLDFEVRIYDDLTCDEIHQVVTQVSNDDHSKNDCLVMAVFSHGDANVLHAKDTTYKPDILWNSFVPSKCPTLTGKPKILFLQACQGTQLDGGTHVQKDGFASRSFSVVDGPPKTEVYKIPDRADFLVVYSTVPGFYSWRSSRDGSWFIQTLSRTLSLKGFSDDMASLLTEVTRTVAIKYESYVPYDPNMDQMKQVPFTTSTLMRKIQLSAKDIYACKGTIKVMTPAEMPIEKSEAGFTTFLSLVKPRKVSTNTDGITDAILDDLDDDINAVKLEDQNQNVQSAEDIMNPRARLTLVKPPPAKPAP